MEESKEYISYMRRMIGHKKMISIGLCCIIQDEEGRILLEKRSDNHQYCLPGGSINFDETVTEGLTREVYEETGIVLKEPKLMMILSGKKEEFIYPNGDMTDYVDLIYYCRMKNSQLSSLIHDGESLELKFYSAEELPKEEEMLRGTMRPIRKFLSGNLELEVD
jgi:8-oxo-dGTP pyrophosphatase MutT (NUDIX family)